MWGGGSALTVVEQLLLQSFSSSWRETAFFQPLGLKHAGVLVRPHDGDLGGGGENNMFFEAFFSPFK